MWIEELFVDEFEGGDDLALRPLHSGLNVIGVSTSGERTRLADFVPQLLYGPRPLPEGGARDRLQPSARHWASGSAIVHARDAAGAEIHLELCRLALNEWGSVSDLQVLNLTGETSYDHEGLEWRQVDRDLYVSLFTNQLPSEARWQVWRNIPAIARLWHTRRAKAPPRVPHLATATPHLLEHPATADIPVATRNPWQDACAAWQAVAPPVEVREAAGQRSVTPVADRTAYLTARQRAAALRQQIQSERDEVARLEERLVGLTVAMDWKDRWQSLQSLNDGDADAAPRVTAADVAELKRIDAQITQLRAELQAHRAHRAETNAKQKAAERSLRDRRAREEQVRRDIEQLLDRYPACHEQWQLVERQRTGATTASPSAAPSGMAERAADPASATSSIETAWSRQDAEVAITRVVAANETLQRCRRAIARWPKSLRAASGTARLLDDASPVARGADADPPAVVAPPIAASPLTPPFAPAAINRVTADDVDASSAAPTANAETTTADTNAAAAPERQVESLQRQIRQLKAESRQLLSRQLLSRQALTGIGLLFSAGIAIAAAALLLDLGGAEASTGAIGVTCIISAALLKLSFERAPSYRLREQRLRVAELVDELKRLGISADDDDVATEHAPHTPAASEPAAATEAPSATMEPRIVPWPTSVAAPPTSSAVTDESRQGVAQATTQTRASRPVENVRLTVLRQDVNGDDAFDDPRPVPSASQRAEALARLQTAEVAWRQLMNDYQLPSVCNVADAVAQLRRRIQKRAPDGDRHATRSAALLAAARMRYEHQVLPWCLAAARCLDEPLEANTEHVNSRWLDPASFQKRLADQLRALLPTGEAASGGSESTARPSTVDRQQQQLKHAKQQRAALLSRAGVEHLAGLEALLEQQSRQTTRVERRRVWEAELAAALQHQPPARAEQIRQWWTANTDLLSLESSTRTQLLERRQVLAARQAELQAADDEVLRWTQLRPVAAPSTPPATTKTAVWHWLGAILQHQAALAPAPTTTVNAPLVADESPLELTVEHDVESAAAVTDSRPAFLRQAERWWQRLTGQTGTTLHWDAIESPLVVEDDAGQRCLFTALAAPARETMTLAVQWALLKAISRRTGRLPLVWTDVDCPATPAAALRRWAKALRRLAQDGDQILVITAANEVVEALNVPTLLVSASHEDPREAALAWPQRDEEVPWDRLG